MSNIRFVLMEGESDELHGLLDRIGLNGHGDGVRVVIDAAREPAPKALAPVTERAAKRTTKATKKSANGCKKCGQPYHSTTHKTKCAKPRTTASPEPTSLPSGDEPSASGTNVPLSQQPLTMVQTNVDTAGYSE